MRVTQSVSRQRHLQRCLSDRRQQPPASSSLSDHPIRTALVLLNQSQPVAASGHPSHSPPLRSVRFSICSPAHSLHTSVPRLPAIRPLTIPTPTEPHAHLALNLPSLTHIPYPTGTGPRKFPGAHIYSRARAEFQYAQSTTRFPFAKSPASSIAFVRWCRSLSPCQGLFPAARARSAGCVQCPASARPTLHGPHSAPTLPSVPVCVRVHSMSLFQQCARRRSWRDSEAPDSRAPAPHRTRNSDARDGEPKIFRVAITLSFRES